MRKHARWIIYIIAAVFILSMAIGGITSIFDPRPVVGIIAGQKIDYAEYFQLLQNQYAAYQQENQNKDIDETVLTQINNQAWDLLVTKILYEKELKQRRIKVRERDIVNRIKNPSDEIKQIDVFHTDGKFDYAKYEEMLLSNELFANQLEQNIRSSLPYELLFDSVKNEVTITEEDVKSDFVNKNNKADAKIIFFDSNKVTQKIEITDEMIETYYNNNKETYKRAPASKLKYVKLTLEPSESDKMKTKERIEQIYQLTLEPDADFAAIAEEYSQDPSAKSGGDLGYFGKGRMVPQFEEIAFSAPLNVINSPIETRFGWHIIQVQDRRKTDTGEEEVKASHILIKFEASEETKDNLALRANDLLKTAKQKGIEEAAKDYMLTAQETRDFFSDASFISGIGRNEELVAFAFKNKIGALFGPFKQPNLNDFYIAEVSYKIGEHYQTLEEAKSGISRTIEREKKVEAVIAKANEFVKTFQPQEFLIAAANNDWEIIEQKGILFDTNLPKIRKNEDLNKAILAAEIGEFTPLITGENGAYIAFVETREKPNMQDFEANKENYYDLYKKAEENKHLNNWYKELKEKAKIIDNRQTFFDYL